MNYFIIRKASAFIFSMTFFVCISKAQNLNETELKLDINKISNSTEQLKKLEPITFKYNTDNYEYLKLPKGNQYGFLESSVQSEFPNIIQNKSTMYNSGKNNTKVAKYNEVKTESLIPVLVAAIKEQQNQIDILKKELAVLKEKSK